VAVAGAPRSSGVLRNGDFVRLLSGQTISVIGTQITMIAIPLTAILRFDAGAFQLGLLGAIEYLPWVVFSLPVGVWVDRVRRRPVMIAADIGRFVVIGSIPVAAAAHVLGLAQLYVVAFLSGFFAVLFEISYVSYVPSIVGRAELLDANGKLEASRTAGEVAGPGIAGLLVQALSAPVALAADSASFLVSAASLALIRKRELKPRVGTPGSQPNAVRLELAQGLRYVFGHPVIRPLTLSTAGVNLFANMGGAVLLLYAVRTLHMRPAEIGGVLTVAAAGAFIGALMSRRIGRKLGVGPTVIASGLLIGLGWCLVPVASGGSTVWVLIAALMIGGFGGVVFNVHALSLRQAIAPPALHGRMNATVRFLAYGAVPIGALVGGALGRALGLRPTLWVAAAGVLVVTLLLWGSSVAGLRLIPEPEEIDRPG
jgi:MFS family permease